MAAGWLCRALLVLYRREFREELGSAMVRDFQARSLEKLLATGWTGWMRWMGASFLSLAGNALAERRDRRADRRGRHLTDGPAWRPSLNELRFVLRSLGRSPGFTAAALATLTVGVGANTAVFSVMKGVVLRPLPYRDPDALVTVWSRWRDVPKTSISAEEYQNYREQVSTLSDIAVYREQEVNVTERDAPARLSAVGAAPNFLEVLGVRPELGRGFTLEEAEAEARVVLLGHALWQSRYGGAASAVGGTIEVDGTARQILGVLPSDFRLPSRFDLPEAAELVFPIFVDPRGPAPAVPPMGGDHGLLAVGRLAEGVTASDAQDEIARTVERLTAQGVYPADWQFGVLVVPMIDEVLGPLRGGLWLLFGAVGFVLLIACANVANLQLARSERQQGNLAVMAALGAGRARLFRVVIAESAVLGLAGSALGLVAAWGALRALLRLVPPDVPRADAISLDGGVLVYAIGVGLLTTLAFGLVPALRASVSPPSGRNGAQSGRTTGGSRLQQALVASQTALAVVLLVGSALMARTFLALARTDLGFSGRSALTVNLGLPDEAYPGTDAVSGFYDRLLDRVRQLPSVERAAVVRRLPLATVMGTTGSAIEGYQPPAGERPQLEFQAVSDGYFETMGIAVLAGRAFLPSDGPATDALVVNQAMVERYWSGSDPLGRWVYFMGDTARVVGVVADVAHNGVEAERGPGAYRLQRQLPDEWIGAARAMTLVVKASRAPVDLIPALRSEVRALDPSLIADDFRTLEEVLVAPLAERRFIAATLGAFGAAALLLATIGVYGVLSYAVGRRTREMGLRIALGAPGRSVVALVVARGLTMVGVGVLAGLAGAFALTRFLTSFLYGVVPRDPGTFAAVAALFMGVALAASWLPAKRASSVDPATALRAD